MIPTRIRCKHCKTILDTEVLKIEKQQGECKCGAVMLDWHGCKILGDFNLVDTLGDKDLEEDLIKRADFKYLWFPFFRRSKKNPRKDKINE